MARAVVMAGGGPVGVAWYAGLAQGLAEGGVDLRDTDYLVGTSAGAIIGSWLASGATTDELIAASERRAARSLTFDAQAMLDAFTLFAEAEGEVTPETARRIAAIASAADCLDPAQYRERILVAVPEVDTWPAPLRVTTVDAETGELRVHGPDDDVPLADAVVASSTVPGVGRPATVDGRPHIDGGLRSFSNADLAADLPGVDHAVIILTATERMPLIGPGIRRDLDRELAVLDAADVDRYVLEPREEDGIGPDLYGADQVELAVESGRARGRKEADGLRAWLDERPRG